MLGPFRVAAALDPRGPLLGSVVIQVDSDSGDDEDQRAAIALVRKKEAAQREEELQNQRQMRQFECPTTASPPNSCSEGQGPSDVCQPTGTLSDQQVPTSEAGCLVQCADQAGKENREPATDMVNGEAHSTFRTGQRALEDDHRQTGAREPCALPHKAAEPTQCSTQQPSSGPPARRRKAPGNKAPAQSAGVPAPHQKGTGEGLSDFAARTRGRAAVRRKETTVPLRADMAGRNDQSEPSRESASAPPVTTSTNDPAAASSAVRQRATVKHAVVSRPQPKAALRHVPIATVTKVDACTRGRLEEKPPNAREVPAGKRRLAGGASAPEVNRARQRRI